MSYPFVRASHNLIIVITQTCHLTYNMIVRWVSVHDYVHSLKYMYAIYGAVCFEFTYFTLDDYETIYIEFGLIIIKPVIWNLSRCLGLDHETIIP